MLANQHGIAQVLHVVNQGPCIDALVLLVQFIAQQQVFVVFRQPTLVGIGIVVVRDAHGGDVAGIRGVHDGELIRVGAEDDGLAHKIRVRPIVNHALGIVGVPRLTVVPHQNGRSGIGQIECHQATAREVGTHSIKQSRRFVDDHVVRVGERSQPRRGSEGRREVRQIAQLIQVQHLQPVTVGLRNDVGMVGIHLHVTPRTR